MNDNVPYTELLNLDGVVVRFHPSEYQCPQCKQNAIDDDWPPNYGGGRTMGGGSKGFSGIFRWGSSQKCVCLNCKIAFIVWEENETHSLRPELNKFDMGYRDVVPLVQM